MIGENDAPKRRRGYVAIPNHVAADQRLTIAARGLLVYLQSHSDGWQFKAQNVAKACGVGRDKLQLMMNELRQFGYLSTAPVFGPGGKITHHDWIIDVDPTTPLKIHPMVEPADGGDTPLKKPISKKPETEEPLTPKRELDLFREDPQKETGKQLVVPAGDRFTEFWDAYPSTGRKVGRPQVREKFEAIVAGRRKGIPAIAADVLIEAMKACVAATDPQFLCAPIVWLNQARWEAFTPKPVEINPDAAKLAWLMMLAFAEDVDTDVGQWSSENRDRMDAIEAYARRNQVPRLQIESMRTQAMGIWRARVDQETRFEEQKAQRRAARLVQA